MDPIKNSVINAVNAHALPLLQVLIEGGGDVNTANQDGYTILMLACEHGYIDIVNFLVEKDVDVHVKDKNGRTALHIAENADQQEIVKILKKMIIKE